jgi:hypothetical protein
MLAATAALIAILSASSASAQRTTLRGLTDWSRYAAATFKRQEPAFRRFVIDRASVRTDRLGRMVGNQYITAIFSGGASYDAGGGARNVTFVCLHNSEKGALLVYTVPR